MVAHAYRAGPDGQFDRVGFTSCLQVMKLESVSILLNSLSGSSLNNSVRISPWDNLLKKACGGIKKLTEPKCSVKTVGTAAHMHCRAGTRVNTLGASVHAAALCSVTRCPCSGGAARRFLGYGATGLLLGTALNWQALKGLVTLCVPWVNYT